MPTNGAAHFQQAPYLVPVAAGTFTPPGGAAVAYSATSMPAYYDAWLAQAWADEANRLISDTAAINALYVDIAGASYESGVRQVEYVYKVFSAIANFYNALNIPWMMHPAARELYRRWISGPPKGIDLGQSIVEASEFAKDVEYRDGWYSYRFPWPWIDNDAQMARYADTGNTPAGIMPTQARTLFNRYYPPGPTRVMQWVQLAGLYMDVEDYVIGNPRDLPEPVNGASTVRNRAFAMASSGLPMGVGARPRTYVRCDGHAEDPGLPAEVQNDAFRFINGDSNMAVVRRFRSAVMFNSGIPYSELPLPPGGTRVLFDGTRVTNIDAMDWRLFQFDESLVDAPLKACNPLDVYLGWAREWVAAIRAQPPVQVLIAARFYTLYSNAAMLRTNTSIEDAIQTDPALAAQVHTPDPTANAILTATGAIGGTLVAAGPVGIAGALVLGFISAAGRVINAVVDHGINATFHRDDLGTFKPYVQRAMLSGSVRTGLEQPPSIQVPAPAGWTRPVTLMVIPGIGLSTTDPQTVDGASLLRQLGMTYDQWTALDQAAQDAALNRIGISDDAARISARSAIQFYGDPSSRPHENIAGVSGGTAVMLAAAALAVYLISRSSKR